MEMTFRGFVVKQIAHGRSFLFETQVKIDKLNTRNNLTISYSYKVALSS